MACDQKTLMLISCYADGEAVGEQATRAAAHLERCAECRKLVGEWQGSQQLLEWACTFELPDEINVESGMVAVPQKTVRRLSWPRLRWNWLAAGGLTAAIAVVFIGYWFATLPPVLPVGKSLVSANRAQAARMGSDVRLTLGPNSKIVRKDERTVSLVRGWVMASVRGGSGIEVDSPRLKVTDRGTRFQVGTQPKLDYVLVDEGSVSVSDDGANRDVKAGQALIARDGQGLLVADLPADKTEDIERSNRLGELGGDDQPRTAAELDRDEGRERLAAKFPDLRTLSGESYGSGRVSGRRTESRYGLSPLVGFRSGLREHFADIAEAMAGGTADSGYWEIPVGVMHASGIISTPQLPADTYYVQLVCQGGAIVWRLNATRGGQVEYPLVTRTDDFGSHSLRPLCGRQISRRRGGMDVVDIQELVTDWPGKIKPALEITVGYVSIEPELAIRDRAVGLAPAVTGLALQNEHCEVSYLDPEKRHHLVVIWRSDSVKQLCDLFEGTKLGQGGSVTLGVLETDVPLEEPVLPAAAYLMRFVISDPSKAPRLEIASAGRRGAPAYALRKRRLETEADPSRGGAWIPDPGEGYGRVGLSCDTVNADGNAFPLRVQVVGLPDDLSTRTVKRPEGGYSWQAPSKVWAEGWIRIRRP